MARVTPKQEIKLLRRRRDRLNALLLSAMNETLVRTKQRLITKNLNRSRKSSTGVRKQSGRLQQSIVTTKATRGPGVTAVGSFTINSKYAGVHIGKRGARTRISAQGGGNLAIPTKFARAANRVPLGVGPRDPRFNITHVAITRKGSKVMFGTVGGSEKIRPLFTLKKSVVVPVRVDIQQDIVRPAQALYSRLVKQGLGKALK